MSQAAEPSTSDPLLTQMRRQLWQAIDNWPTLTFRRKWVFEGRQDKDAFESLEPRDGDLPAIAIVPAEASSGWVLNQSQEIAYPLQIAWFTQHYDLVEGERIWQEIHRAAWQCKPNETALTYLRTTNADLVMSSPVVTQFSPPDQIRFTRWDMAITIKRRWNPTTD